jgi:hypothetical protein
VESGVAWCGLMINLRSMVLPCDSKSIVMGEAGTPPGC